MIEQIVSATLAAGVATTALHEMGETHRAVINKQKYKGCFSKKGKKDVVRKMIW